MPDIVLFWINCNQPLGHSYLFNENLGVTIHHFLLLLHKNLLHSSDLRLQNNKCVLRGLGSCRIKVMNVIALSGDLPQSKR